MSKDDHKIVKVGRASKASMIVENIDLGPIAFKLAHPEDGEGWAIKKIQNVAEEYRRFLILCAEYPEHSIVPSKDVDTFWHYHILDTKKYSDDCARIFGYFLHHFPYLGLRGEQDAKALLAAYATTRSLYSARFGTSAGEASADCMVGCGSVVCTSSSCTNNEIRRVNSVDRPSLSFENTMH